MLKLPKILEETSPLIKQYRDIVLSKNTSHKSITKSPPSKYDWITSQLLLVQLISHEAILKNITNFQLICKEKNIRPFYSYFILKSLFMNKNLKVKQKQNLQQARQITQSKEQETAERPLTAQTQTFLMEIIDQETKKIQTGFSAYHKIQNCISLRQELLEHFFGDSRAESQNAIHQNANNIRYLNFELIEMIKSWKKALIQLQTKTFTGQNLTIDSLETIEPIYVYEDQNYLCKMIYDNANAINAANLQKNSKFISPPNPFFLSQDGNKGSMSQKEKEKIDETMELIAKQKAFELKIILDQPEYMSKKINFRESLRSSSTSRLKLQKSSTSYRKDDPFKKLFGSLSKLQLPQKKYNQIKEFKVQSSAPKKNHYASTNSNRGQSLKNDKVLSVYQARASKLREQIQKNTETRDKFQTMVKKSQLQMLKDLRKKKTPPKQTLPKFTIELKTFEERLKESPYKQRVSSLRREVEKNVTDVKLTKKEIPYKVQKLDESILTFKTQNTIKRPMIEVKTTAPKMKIIQEKEVNIEKVPNPIIIAQKVIDEKNSKQKSLSRSKEKEKIRKSYSTFFKTPQEEQMQKQMMRQSRFGGNKVMKDPSDKQKITTLKSSELNRFATTSNFYKNSGVDTSFQNGSKRKTSQPNVIKEKTVDQKNQETMRSNIDLSLKNLKQRLRNMEIMKAYGKRSSYPKKRQMSEMSLSAIREDEHIEGSRKVSPKRKQQAQKKNRSTFLKKQAEMLESKIQKLLKKQQKSFRFDKENGRIHEQEQENHDYRTVNRLDQVNTERLSQAESIFDKNMRNLQKKEELIHQSNQMKQKQIEQTSKNKHKIEQQVNQRRQRVRLMEQKIAQMKHNRKANANQSQETLKQSLLNESRELAAGQQAIKVKQLKQTQTEMKRQNQNLRLQMIQEQQKFIKLKQEEYRMRQELNKKKYLEELQQVKSKYILKQQEYQKKILQQERLRKQNQIRLMKEKRETQELQMKLHEQEMKQILLKDILQKQHQRWREQSKQADTYHYEVKKLISTELQENEQQQLEVNKIYLDENYKLMTLTNQMRQKNFKIEQANRIRLEEVQRAIKEREQEIRKLQELQREVQKLQKSRISAMEDDELESVSLPVTTSAYVPLEEDGIEDLKLRLKQEILKEMIQRRKRQEQEELKFEEQRKRRLKILQSEIKDFLRKQGEISKVLEYARPDEIKNINVESILNRQVLHQEQLEIDAKVKSMEELRNEVQLADKKGTTVTTEYQTAYGQKSKNQTSSHGLTEQPKSSLKHVLDSHSRPEKINSSLISNTSINKENRQDSSLLSQSAKPVQNNDQISQSKNQHNELSKIQEVDRSHSYVHQSKGHHKNTLPQKVNNNQTYENNFQQRTKKVDLDSQIDQRKKTSPPQVNQNINKSDEHQTQNKQKHLEERPDSKRVTKTQFNQQKTSEPLNDYSPLHKDELKDLNQEINKKIEQTSRINTKQDETYQKNEKTSQKIVQKLIKPQIVELDQESLINKSLKKQQSDDDQPRKRKPQQKQQSDVEQLPKNKQNQISEPVQEQSPKKKQGQEPKSQKEESPKIKTNKKEQSDQDQSPKTKKNKKQQSGNEEEQKNRKRTQKEDNKQKSKKIIEPEQTQDKQRKDLERQKPTQKPREISQANNSLIRKFGQISSIQQQDLKQLANQSKLQQSYRTVERPNDTFDQSRSVRQKVFKSDEEMLQKFHALKEYLKTDTQFVTIQQAQIDDFLDKFYDAYPQEVQEMFCFTKPELLTILKNHNSMDRKIDLFDCQSIGWYDRTSNKYILTGSLGCVHLIAQKYGEIQIEMAYVFDRANHKQKKFLVKEIKVFEKVGSLFQKKLEQENHYSLKLIIKITKDMIPQECHIPDELVHFNSLVTLQPSPPLNSKTPVVQKHKLIFQHMLADCMWQYMKKQQIQEYAVTNAKDSIDLNIFAKSLQSFNQNQACKELKDYISNQEEMTAQLDMYFKLPYIQLGKKIHYQIKADQYQLKNGERVYLTKHCLETEDQEALWKFLVFETNKNVLQDNFLQTLLKAKVKQLNKIKPQRELNLVLPLFKIDQSFTAGDNEGLKQNYRHKSLIDGDLIRSSISCANSVVEVERKLITLSKKSPEMGFVFCACYAPGDQIEKVVAGSWVGYSDLIR